MSSLGKRQHQGVHSARAHAGLRFCTAHEFWDGLSLAHIYLMFVNQSKQERMKPLCHMMHHLAYIPSVSHITAN